MADSVHGSARTTPRPQAEFEASKETTNILAQCYGLSRTTGPSGAAEPRGPTPQRDPAHRTAPC